MENYNKEVLEFIRIHKDKIVAKIPFTYVDHYDVIHINPTDLELYKGSSLKTIETYDDFEKSYYADILAEMIVSNEDSANSWMW